ncbi:MAG: (R,R)-butanediol dehydrogenase/meso-butanediol dehydrogenase/diacetyl reductase [Verrucomicrobiales bacterium]|jgi:(R,R)-butanediol dehydrogenase/meso-butanediol dehydrogenase/diacetyl reductase
MFPIDHRHPVTGHCGPMVPGHEFSGFVADTGPDVSGFSVGDLITSGAGISCGTCPACVAGRNNLCIRYSTVGLERDGALAEFTTVPAAACINLDGRSLSPDVAALAQPMSIGVHAMRRGQARPGDEVVVLGAGGIGSFIVHAAAKQGARVTAIDLDADRLSVASKLGAQHIVHPSVDAPVSEQLEGIGIRPNIVYECTGTAPALDSAIELTNKGGRVVLVGLQKGAVAVELLSVTLQEKELIGTLAHVFGADFGHSVDLLEDERELWAAVAPSVQPLDDVVSRGLDPMINGGPTPIKALFDPTGDQERPLQTS